MKTKCYGYIRVSTDNQEESLEVQELRIRQYCEFQNLEIVDLLVDQGVSGFTEIYKRPAGKKLASLGDVKHIVCIKPDRLFRNVKDSLITMDEWDKEGIALHLVDVGGVSLNTKTAIGRLMFTTIISFAQFERDITGERIKAVLNNKKSTGKVYSKGVLGYDNVDGSMVKNEGEQEIIQTMLSLRNNGFNPSRITRILNRVGYRTKSGSKFYRSTVDYIINNPIHNE